MGVDPCHLFGLYQAGPHGYRPGNQVIAAGPHPQAWLQGEDPVTLVQARDILFL